MLGAGVMTAGRRRPTSRHIAQAHGGRVRLRSREQVGSTFVIWPAGPEGTVPPEPDPLDAPVMLGRP